VVSDGGYGQPRNQLMIQQNQQQQPPHQNQQQMMMNDQYMNNNYQPNMTTTVPMVHVQQPSQSISVVVPNGTSPGL